MNLPNLVGPRCGEALTSKPTSEAMSATRRPPTPEHRCARSGESQGVAAATPYRIFGGLAAGAFTLLALSALTTLPESRAQDSAPAVPKKFISITSDFFEYDNALRTATYRGNVTVVDPPPGTNQFETHLTCGLLTVKLPPSGQRLENIVAENNVVMRQGEHHATGSRAIYTSTDDTLVLMGNPVLFSPQGTMRADTFIFDRARNGVRASGPVRTEIDPDKVGKPGTGLFPANPPVNK